MSREWKPGDVAMTAKNTIALCHNGGRMIDQGGAPWSDEKFPQNLRPLVVIDPEDREAVERLLVTYYDHVAGSPQPKADYADLAERLQAALREFANPKPPKPEEPTGLGAVVEDRNGIKWTRAGSSHVDGNWLRVGSNAYVYYADIAAVRVLSVGVQP